MTAAGSAYTSTRRNGSDNDIYIVDPRNPASNRLLAQVKGGGWGLSDFAPDGRSAVVAEYLSVNKTNLYRIDVATGRMTPIGDHSEAHLLRRRAVRARTAPCG